MFLESNTEDSLQIDFRLHDDTDKGGYYLFTITANVNGFNHKGDYWATEEDYRRFVTDLKSLNMSLVGRATLKAATSESDFSFSLIGDRKHRGYLLTRTSFHFEIFDSRGFSTNSLFEGGFFIEPANLPYWLEEFVGALDAAL
jgi:hypothetical protein